MKKGRRIFDFLFALAIIFAMMSYMRMPVKAEDNNYLTFKSTKPFSIHTNNNQQYWLGKLEYSRNATDWNEWNGSKISSSENALYLRGTGNTVITGDYTDRYWVIDSQDLVSCTGDIRSLLNHSNLDAATMGEKCFYYMFENCRSLSTPPELPAKKLEAGCYEYMFEGCTNLSKAPTLPAEELTENCYTSMFSGCESLIDAPALPAKELKYACYNYMFGHCTNLSKAPVLPATNLAEDCYNAMFSGCTNLKEAPALPATTLKDGCYQGMFSGCTSLRNAPYLPATTLKDQCYRSMFEDCTDLKLSETKGGSYNVEYKIPVSGTGTTAEYSLTDMFAGTGGEFTGTPVINKTYYGYGYSVTLTGGNNAIASGGSLTQWVPFVEMKAVTYTADYGSKFKEFEDITNNGITVKRLSDTVVTVSGTPTANVEIAVPDAEKPAPTLIKAPAAKTLTFNGSAQELITAGKAEGGTMYYALGKDATTAPTEGWSTEIPTAMGAGTYYVWHKVIGDENHSDTEPKSITVIIKEKDDVVSDPTSPIHRTDGSDVITVSQDNAVYDFDVTKNPVVIANTKPDISKAFENISSATGYEASAKHRYRSSDPKIAKVDKKGVVTPKKSGEVDIIYEQKLKGGDWTQIGEKLHLYIQLPEMEKTQTVSAAENNLSAYKFLCHTTYSPTKWVSSNKKVATIDDKGNIHILKPGKTNIIAQYGEGKTGSKKKYKTKLKVSK